MPIRGVDNHIIATTVMVTTTNIGAVTTPLRRRAMKTDVRRAGTQHTDIRIIAATTVTAMTITIDVVVTRLRLRRMATGGRKRVRADHSKNGQ